MIQGVTKDCVVTLRYVMRNSRGDVLEDTMQSSPVNYLHGSESILPLLQQQLEGLQRGNKKKVFLSKESGAGDDFYFDVIIDDVRLASPEELLLGYPVQITVDVCNDDCICYTELLQNQTLL